MSQQEASEMAFPHPRGICADQASSLTVRALSACVNVQERQELVEEFSTLPPIAFILTFFVPGCDSKRGCKTFACNFAVKAKLEYEQPGGLGTSIIITTCRRVLARSNPRLYKYGSRYGLTAHGTVPTWVWLLTIRLRFSFRTGNSNGWQGVFFWDFTLTSIAVKSKRIFHETSYE
eukprot:1926895-Amphidinium_carterae.1